VSKLGESLGEREIRRKTLEIKKEVGSGGSRVSKDWATVKIR